MPAVHEDPNAAVFVTGTELPASVTPRQVILRDRVTVATLVPFSTADDVPRSLLAYLSDQLNKEIEKEDTYALADPIPLAQFGPYWFSNFGAIMLLGDVRSVQETQMMESAGADWTRICLGSFNIRPNYPGRSSHICNGMFLVTDAARNRGVGRLMGEGYLEWAPKLGFTYSIFNLVYENNVASCRIWDALGFKRIGKVPRAGKLCSSPGQYVDAIIYGRDLNSEGEHLATQDRFDKIRYYLQHSKYPRGADRAEKSRLRSAATHYKLVAGVDGQPGRLMLKDKEVVSDPQQQYDIARQVHMTEHAGINKTTASIAVKYHWVRIKETVNRVIRDCPQCKGTLKLAASGINGESQTLFQEGDIKSSSRACIDPLIDETSIQIPRTSIQPSTTHISAIHPSIGNINILADMSIPLDPQTQHHSDMTDAYTHDAHCLTDPTLEVETRRHDTSDYRMEVDDDSESEPSSIQLRRGPLDWP